ncbi:hypothetical protein PALU110988_22895 [Paenibacillus lupini]|nr:hypothetical protein [Paenibacillus lupini]
MIDYEIVNVESWIGELYVALFLSLLCFYCRLDELNG